VTNQIHKPTQLLRILSLKLQWTKDSLKNAVWNPWCFWRHKLHCNQSRQCVIVKEWISVLVWVSGDRV